MSNIILYAFIGMFIVSFFGLWSWEYKKTCEEEAKRNQRLKDIKSNITIIKRVC